MPAGTAGGYVRCYTVAEDYDIAIRRCLSQLELDGMLFVDILEPVEKIFLEQWSLHTLEQYPDYCSALLGQEEFEIAMSKNEVVYSPIAVYGNAIPD
jgi:hypothetical protein